MVHLNKIIKVRPINYHRCGTTLIEILVVLSILFLLMGIFFPTLQAAREAARRAACGNNLRHIGLATQNYLATFESFPLGRISMADPRFAGANPRCTSTRVDQGPLVAILPFLEQEGLYAAINQSTSIFALENTTVHRVRVAAYSCPTDASAAREVTLEVGELVPMSPDPPGGTWRMVPTSYAGATGSIDVVGLPASYPGCVVPGLVRGQCDGIFADGATVRSADVTDGLSTTLLFAEKSITLFAEGGAPGALPSQHGWWVSGNFDDSLFSTFYPPDAGLKVSPYGEKARYRSASSLHPGGVQVALADGSVRLIAATVATWPFDGLSGRPIGATLGPAGGWINLPTPRVWQHLATRSGGEMVAPDF